MRVGSRGDSTPTHRTKPGHNRLGGVRLGRRLPESARVDLKRGAALDERSDNGTSPDEIVATRQWIEAIRGALATLTDDQRDAIALRFFAGLSARETAEAMGRQEGTVRGLQFRAIAALRRQLLIEAEGDVTTVATAFGRPTP